MRYTEQDLVRLAKRQNNKKRTYLVVNPLQGKHVPVRPGEAFSMFDCLAELLKKAYGSERLLLVGFAETATAIGAAAAEKLGMIVGVEAVHDHTLYCPEIMRRFLEDMDSPNVEAILDPVNLISGENYLHQDEVIENAFRLYGDRITMVHVKDFVLKDGKPQFAHVGEGLFHYEPLMRNLKSQKPYITMLLENSTKDRYHGDVEYLQKIYEQA